MYPVALERMNPQWTELEERKAMYNQCGNLYRILSIMNEQEDLKNKKRKSIDLNRTTNKGPNQYTENVASKNRNHISFSSAQNSYQY